jgi:hypothetical protein
MATYNRKELIDYCFRRGYNFIAKDPDGVIIAFEKEPTINVETESWQANDGVFGTFKCADIGECDWKDSLIKVWEN